MFSKHLDGQDTNSANLSDLGLRALDLTCFLLKLIKWTSSNLEEGSLARKKLWYLHIKGDYGKQ